MATSERTLNIPEAVWDAIAERVSIEAVMEANGRPSAITDLVEQSIEFAAPLVVVAELERLADELEVVRAEMREEDDRTARSSGLGEGIRRMRARASELRGEGKDGDR